MIEALEFHHEALLREVAEADPPTTDYLYVDKHVAASLLQKAIRRGQVQWALRAALRLLDIDQLRLWRRLSVTVFEDIGLHDPSLAWKVFSARRHCLRLSPVEIWPIAASLVRSMAQAPKSQAANNALYLAAVDPTERIEIEGLADTPISEIEKSLETVELTVPQKLVVVAMLSGRRLADQLRLAHHPDASPAHGRRVAAEMSANNSLLELVEFAVRDGIQLLAASAALIASQDCTEATSWTCSSDSMPPSCLMGDVPSWVFDMYTRAGRAALNSALRYCPSICDVLNEGHIERIRRPNVLSAVHFEFESACLNTRIQRPSELALLQQARLHASSPWPQISAKLFDALCRDWDRFQACRKTAAAQIEMSLR